jgi:formate-dependent nitrite reductase membrane component NrfD
MEGQIQIYWNWEVALYLFLAGVSAGTFAISALAYFLGKERYKRIVKIGAYITPWPVIVGVLLLIADLERPTLFWKLFVSFQPGSVMWIGTWLLTIFLILSFIHLYIWLPSRYDILMIIQRLPLWLGRRKIFQTMRHSKFLARFRQKNFAKKGGLVAGLGLFIAVGVGIYTGILLGVLSARPFWNSPFLPMLFLLSALKCGTASILFVGLFSKGFYEMKKKAMAANKSLIHTIDLVLMVLSFIAICLFIVGLYVSTKSSAEAAKLIMGGEFTFLFWALVVGVGMLFPFAFQLAEFIPYVSKGAKLREYNPWITGVVTASVLLGGFMLRYVVVYAGQVSQVISS